MVGTRTPRPIDDGQNKHAGAVLGAPLYNRVVEYAQLMEVDLSWVIRIALEEFVHRHDLDLRENPKQLTLNLGHSRQQRKLENGNERIKR